jgi:hypothetical protein
LSYEKDPRVDEYIDVLPEWQQAICRAGEQINRRALRRMFEQIIANNRAGGWRQLKAQG